MFSGSRLKECREASGLSQESLMIELAREGLRVSRMTIFKWETGVTAPGLNDLCIIAKYFKKSLEFFLDRKQSVS